MLLIRLTATLSLIILSILIETSYEQKNDENNMILNTLNSMNEKNSSELVNKCDRKLCKLPLCKCADTETPNKLDLNDIPMMIMLTFNGILQKEHSDYYKKILNPLFKNPNGCPVQATFFVSDTGYAKTDYCLVQKLFNNNNEIAVGAPKYNCPYYDCKSAGRYFMPWGNDKADSAVFEQKRNIARKGKINRSFLRGFRVPYLDTNGNTHYKALKKYAFNYDSSVIIKPQDIKNLNGLRLWPHTLDYPVPYNCDNCPTAKTLCDSKNCSMESFWIVPMHYMNAESKNPCPTLIPFESLGNRMSTRSCIKAEEITENLLETMIYENFKRHYETNKAPFVLNIETSWFNKYGEMLSEALVKFIHRLTIESNKNLTNNNDIYFVSIAKGLDWIEYPVSLDVIANKWLWDCDGVDFDYDQECDFVDQQIKNAEVVEHLKQAKKKMELDLRAEDLFRNGILTGVIVIFILAIIFVILYDRYH